ncbi:MAG TPA: leucine-rich repeat domain-containing protein [Bacilli bacterium]|jgi:hypothetical protein|nr:leucine-rich repeat domain-containing protein [Bacilli bacterium]
MKKNKNIFIILFALLLAISSILLVSCGESSKPASPDYLFNFTLNSDGRSYTISAEFKNIEGEIVIPNSYSGLPVKNIGSFSDCVNITSVIIPSSINIIENQAFKNCKNLTNVSIPKSVTKIGSEAFSTTGLKSIVIPSSITKIEDHAFYFCTNLVDVTIPNSVKEIGDDAFFVTGFNSITFKGTKNQWSSIKKGLFWCNLQTTYTIRCNDGNITYRPNYGI